MEPTISGTHHIAITVHDPEQSERWYTEVLGFFRVGPPDGEGFRRILLRHPSGTVLGLTKHDHAEASELFSERRTGLDHVAFQVADQEQLEAWIARLDELGVAHSEIKHIPIMGSTFIVLRDPDNI